ncbi:MAG: hypothetical protein Q4F13_08195 [Pseudomonadota bacterium]|nr:hypothetical protein [Pseudomonadota bacterium]
MKTALLKALIETAGQGRGPLQKTAVFSKTQGAFFQKNSLRSVAGFWGAW